MQFFSVIFGSVSLILVFFDNKTILRFLCRIPEDSDKSSKRCILYWESALFFSSGERSRQTGICLYGGPAVVQFYPGGMAGGPGTPTPPGPSENFGILSYPLEGESSHQGERRGSPSLSAEVPLLSDTQRRIELESELERLIEHNVYKKPLSDTERGNFTIKVRSRMLSVPMDFRTIGFIILARRIAFTTDSKPQPISFKAIKKQMLKHNNIKNTIYYKRIKKALKNYTLRI